MQEEESIPYLGNGLMFKSILGGILATTILVLAVLLCACFKRTRRSNVTEEHKNGHMFGSSRHSSALDVEYDEEGLKGARATSHRRLPDLPDPLLNGSENPVARHSSVRSSQDTSSELYAQVEIGAIANSFPVNNNTNESSESALRMSAASFSPQADEASETHPYDKVKSNHGYSKIKKKAENPYAKVKRSDTMESEPAEADENETDTDNYDVVYTMHSVDETRKPETSPNGAASGSVDTSLHPPPLPLPLRGSHSSLASGESGSHGPRPPPRGRRGHSIVLSHSSSNGNIHRPNSMISSDQEVTGPDALDGAAAAQNDILPEVRGAGAAQIHFSGDSQTSQDSKGYSSISVREPLANLKALNPGGNVGRQRTGSSSQHHRQPDSLDPHYATVSDAEDSDEMYAAIAELQPIYDSGAGSDTYAKINDRSEAHSITSNSGAAAAVAAAVVSSPVSPTPYLPTEAERILSSSPVPPTPPSVVSLKQLSTGSSRLHASTLSIASQTSGVGSPKPEKRQANSPLPPPPVHLDLTDSLERSRKSMNVEEMYAKVMKKKGFSMHPWQAMAGEPGFGKTQAHRGSVDLGFLVNREGESYSHNPSRRNSMDATPHSGLDVNDNGQVVETAVQEVVVAVVEEDDEDDDFRYEMLPAPRASNRKISENDPGYEKIQLKSDDSFSDPRYERIHLRNSSEVEPNYEVVGFRRATGLSESSEPGYEIVELPTQGFNRQDPNYESLHYSVHQIASDPPYASIAARDIDLREEEFEEILEETTTELVVNNNTVGIPVYAQVTKSKRAVAQSNIVAVVECPPPTATGEMSPTSPRSVHSQDFSVSSSKNTTIIRITDNRPPLCYFTDDDTFGVPEQV